MPTSFKTTIAAFLLPLMVLCAGPLPAAFGQESNVQVINTTPDDDKTDDYILIGLFVVVIGILVVLGIQTDRERSMAQQEKIYGELAMQAPVEPSDLQLTAEGVRLKF